MEKVKDLASVATAEVAAVGFSQQKPEKVQAATTTKAKKQAKVAGIVNKTAKQIKTKSAKSKKKTTKEKTVKKSKSKKK